MRTIIRLEDSLLAEAKRIAADQGSTLSSVIENALRQSFAHRECASKRVEYPSPQPVREVCARE